VRDLAVVTQRATEVTGMVVARLPGPSDRPAPGPGRALRAVEPVEPVGTGPSTSDPASRLADRWADLLPGPGSPAIGQLRTLLRRLSTVLRADPFWPPAARRIGASFYHCGPAGRPLGPGGPQPEELLPPTLGLLRSDAQAMLGTPGPEGARRLATALDQLVAGYLGAMRERAESERQDLLTATRWPPEDLQRVLTDGDLHYRALYLRGRVGIAVGSLAGDVIDANPALYRLFGADDPPEFPHAAADFVHPDDLATFVESYHQVVSADGPDSVEIDVRLVRPDRIVVWARVNATLVRNDRGEPDRVVAVVQDISERHRLHSRLERATTLDRLTRLPNRGVAEAQLRQAFAPGAARRAGLCAVDIDGFRSVNDTLGHAVGDELLFAVAGRLQMAAGDHLVTRTGGDEFAVLAVDTTGADDMTALADRLLDALAPPFQLAGRSLTVTASIGVSEAPTATTVPEELMRSADVAMSWAKAQGGGRRVLFDPERDAGEAARFTLLAALPEAVDRGEFRLAFQPLVRLRDEHVLGTEALVRWQHPVEGVIGPGRFIELAERSGAIVSLGRWVLREACRQAACWHEQLGEASPYVSVNVSPVQLVAPGWFEAVTDALTESGLPPHKLQLEITEQAVLGDEALALDVLAALRGAQVRLALDDFGTGWSSLAWLRRLPVHALKIDGSFIDGLRHTAPDPMDESIVRALVELAHALDLEVTAEWVETRTQAERLERLGCDLGQGRWFGDAGPAAWVPDLVRRSLR
jgi:diguanylate cyclase (GGDEF)-like protein/PAS domain S-box-containing protein